MKDSDMASGETARGLRILESGGFQTPATESVLIQSRDVHASDPAFQAAIASVVQDVSLDKNVTNVQNPLLSPKTQISKDRHSALVQFDLKGKRDDADGKIQPILERIADVQKANPPS
jgi:hypothetical protein